MLRRLQWAGAAVALAGLFLLVLAHAAPALAATTAAEATAVTIPYGTYVVGVLNLLTEVLVPVLVAVITWAIHTYVPVFGAFVSQALVQKVVQNAIDYATNAVDGAVKGQQLTVQVGSSVIAKGTQRAVDQAPAWLLNLAGGPAGIAEKIFRVLHLEPGSTAANTLAPVLASLPPAKA